MPISLHAQAPVIHNRQKHKPKSMQKYTQKCYEWEPHDHDSWETQLTWQVRLPESAYSGEGAARKVLPGLAMFQKVTYKDEFFIENEKCGKTTMIVNEVFPLTDQSTQRGPRGPQPSARVPGGPRCAQAR